MNYTFSFPYLNTSTKVEVIKTLRQLCPGLGIKETKNIVEQSGHQVLNLTDSLPERLYDHALSILRNYGVVIIEGASDELPEWRKVETDTLSDLRTVAIAALDRGEHDIAIALIELIKRNS